MKVRKFLFAGALIVIALFSVNSVMAQTNTDQVTVNLKFRPIQTISVNAESVDITYVTLEDYSSGKTTGEIADHIKIYSTGGFEVKVRAAGDFKRVGGGEDDFIPVGHVIISATAGTNAPTTSEYAIPASLKTLDAKLVSAAVGGTDINYKVEYNNVSAGEGNNYINKYIFVEDEDESVYSTTVTYTIAAK